MGRYFSFRILYLIPTKYVVDMTKQYEQASVRSKFDYEMYNPTMETQKNLGNMQVYSFNFK